MRVALAGRCSVKQAAELRQSLHELGNAAAAVILDVNQVERIDTAALQVLCAFARERAEGAHPTSWDGDVAVVREAAMLLGVEAMLRLPASDAVPEVSMMGEASAKTIKGVAS